MVGDLPSGLRESNTNGLGVLFKTVGFLTKMGFVEDQRRKVGDNEKRNPAMDGPTFLFSKVRPRL